MLAFIFSISRFERNEYKKMSDSWVTAAVHNGVQRDDVKLLTTYLDEGGSVELYDHRGGIRWCLLHTAAHHGSTKCMSVLLDRGGANINETDRYGQTALHHAAIQGNIEAIILLLDKSDSNIDAVDNTGHTPLHYAAIRGNMEALILLLDKSDSNIDAADNNGRTPLHNAVQFGHVGCVCLLLKYGANRKIIDREGFKPKRMCSYIKKQDALVQILKLLTGGSHGS